MEEIIALAVRDNCKSPLSPVYACLCMCVPLCLCVVFVFVCNYVCVIVCV